MEVFCGDITEADLQQLKEYMTKDSKLFDVPPLGEHYAQQWAEVDLDVEQEAALSSATSGSREGGYSDPLYRRLDKPPTKPSSDPLGPLTQRLMAVCLTTARS